MTFKLIKFYLYNIFYILKVTKDCIFWYGYNQYFSPLEEVVHGAPPKHVP